MNLKIKEYKNYFSNFGIEYTTNSIFNSYPTGYYAKLGKREVTHDMTIFLAQPFDPPVWSYTSRYFFKFIPEMFGSSVFLRKSLVSCIIFKFSYAFINFEYGFLK